MALVLVGNAPSSGSTLLGDLLDSTPYSVCGPELGMFTDKRIYTDFPAYKEKLFARNISSSIYAATNGVNRGRLFNYALDEGTFRSLVADADTPEELVQRFGDRFTNFRGKPGAVLIEKTPRNIEVAKEFLDCFSDGYFVHIVRNPVYVSQSLINRGIPPGIAIFTWLFQIANVYKIESPRLITICYEDLIDNPWGTVAEIVSRISGAELSEETVEKYYLCNTYRKHVSLKNESWSVHTYGEIKNCNKKDLPSDFLVQFKAALEWRISDAWARDYGVPPLKYKSAIEDFGYAESVMELLEDVDSYGGAIMGFRDYEWLLRKKLGETVKCAVVPRAVILPVQKT